jgi:hypothetical protein
MHADGLPRRQVGIVASDATTGSWVALREEMETSGTPPELGNHLLDRYTRAVHLFEGCSIRGRKGLPAKEGRRASCDRRLDGVPGHWKLPHEQGTVNDRAAWREQARIVEEA